MAEEVIAQEASAQLGEEAEDIADAVHHWQAPQVLLPIEGRGHCKTTGTATQSQAPEKATCPSVLGKRVFVQFRFVFN